jgi:MFS family permease
MTLLERSAYIRHARQFSRNARLYLSSQILAGVGSGIFSLLFNLYLVRLGYHEDFIGQVAGLTTLATGLVCLPAGLIGDRLGRRNSLLLGGIIVPLAYLGEVVVQQAQAILAFGVLAGAGMAFVMISMSPFMAENSSPDERSYLFSANFALSTLFGMLGSFTGGILPALFGRALGQGLESAVPYQVALLVAVALFAVAALPFYFLRSDSHPAAMMDVSMPDVSMKQSDIQRRVAGFVAVNVLVGIAGGVILPFFNVFFLREYHLSSESVGLIFGISLALIGIAALLAPAVVRRVDKVSIITLGHFSATPFLIVLSLMGNVWLAVGAYWGRNVAMNMLNPVWGAFAMEMVPRRLRATLSGINNTAWNMTWAISSTVGGFLILSLGYQKVFLFSALMYAVAGAVFFLSFRRYRRI